MNEHERCLVAIRFLLTYFASIMLIALSLASFDGSDHHDLFDRRYHVENILAIASILSGIFLLVSLHVDFYLEQTKYGNSINKGGSLLRILWSWIAGILLLSVGISGLSDYGFSGLGDETGSYGLSNFDNSALPMLTLWVGGLLIFWSIIERKLMKFAK